MTAKPFPAVLLFLTIIAGLFSGFSMPLQAAPAHPPGRRLLLFVGSNTLGEEAVPELAKAWLEQEKKATAATIERHGDIIFVTAKTGEGEDVYVEVHATGSGDCFKSFMGTYTAANAACDIGMSSRRATGDEADAIKEKCGSDLYRRGTEPGAGCEHPVAMDGLAIVVSQSNPLSRISFSELRDIYSRKMVDWKEAREWKLIGGAEAGLAVAPFRRKEPSGTLDFFKQRIQPDAGPMKDEKAIPAFTGNGDLASRVAETPGGIGFVGEAYSFLPGLKRLQVYDDTPPMNMEPVEAAFPDRTAVRLGSYPLSRIVYLYTQFITGNPEVQPFIRFALSEEGQVVIADKGHLVKVEGTREHITLKAAQGASSTGQPAIEAGGRNKQVILRLAGSNTVGAECAVNLAFNYLTLMARNAKQAPKIEDITTEMETPEGEKALAHDVMCDINGSGTWLTIEIRPTGSGDAFRDLNAGACDVGMSSRPITDAERRDLTENCGDLAQSQAQFALGLDGLAIIVSKDNPLEQITIEQLRRVFLGEVKNWSELGGADRPIQLHARPARSGTYKYFCDSVLQGKSIPSTAHRHSENALLAATVAKDAGGIGFVPMTRSDGAKVLKVGHEGSTTFTAPSEESVRAGRYPARLCRYVYLYVPKDKPSSPNVMALTNWPAARAFARISQTWDGQAVVAGCGFVTEPVVFDEGGTVVRAADEPLQKYLPRLHELEKKAMLGQLKLAPRLSDGEVCPKLLFAFNGELLTPESKDIIDVKLGPWLKMYPSVLKAGLIAEGWSDAMGTDEACQKVALHRAQIVADYVTATLGCKVAAVGLGKASDLPNSNEENKQLNRRVVLRLAEQPEIAAPVKAPAKEVKAPAKEVKGRRKTAAR